MVALFLFSKMADTDSFQMNIDGVSNLVESGANKTRNISNSEEGVVGDYEDILDLPMEDDELLALKIEWENKSNTYTPKVKARQDKNKVYYQGKQTGTQGSSSVVSSNLIFEAEETFIPQALSKNPEPVVWSDNTDEGKEASNDVKTMLQYHADVLCLRKKLGVMVRHWSIYFIGVVKHGWDSNVKDIKTETRKPQNFVLDPNGYIDEYGNYVGAYLGERIESSAKELIELFPKHREYILIKVNAKLGTPVVRTEWWTDEYCFTTFEDKVLDKHKNPYFNYDVPEKVDEAGEVIRTATPGVNHFAVPKMPYTFLSVFSLQETPHDITNLIEQNIPNQDRITDRDIQISKNLRASNNSIVLSGLSFTVETGRQAATALEDGDPVLVPDGQVEKGVKRLPANNLPDAIFKAQSEDKDTLRSVFGTQGLTAAPDTRNTTARGMILNQSHDSTRIGGGVGDALEQVADNIFNWWLQLYYVFYDEPHYGAIMGNGKAVEYVQIVNTNLTRKFVVSVSPNSMQPKDEISEQNLAIDLANKGWLDPINLFKKLNYPDPMETAKMVVLWKVNPAMYLQSFFPESQPLAAPGINPNPPDIGGIAPPQDESLGAPPASPALSQVPLSSEALPK